MIAILCANGSKIILERAGRKGMARKGWAERNGQKGIVGKGWPERRGQKGMAPAVHNFWNAASLWAVKSIFSGIQLLCRQNSPHFLEYNFSFEDSS